jgi:hypothetical protein
MSLRIFLGWVIGILGLLVVLAVFGLDFGVHAPFAPLVQIIIGVGLIVIGLALATGRPVITS